MREQRPGLSSLPDQVNPIIRPERDGPTARMVERRIPEAIVRSTQCDGLM